MYFACYSLAVPNNTAELTVETRPKQFLSLSLVECIIFLLHLDDKWQNRMAKSDV